MTGSAAPLPIALLENKIQEYAWGSRTAIAELLGRPTPSPEPQAEMWMGAHPRAPSRVRIDGRERSLLELIRSHPREVLGPRVCERFSGRLPFLFKVLAVERPLSVQAHPDARQASAGFARDEARGIGRDAPTRSYPDASHKPELVCALTPFQALCGFRPVSEIRALVDRLEVPGLSAEAARLERGSEEAALRDFLAGLLRMDRAQRLRVVGEVAAAAAARGGEESTFECVVRLHDEHPGDLGVLAPLFLNAVLLEPGQAMFVQSGELHSYLHGLSVELMANSDNVLRGGLTAKAVDVHELLRILRFRATRVDVLTPETDEPGSASYRPPADEFRLSRLEIGEDAPFTCGPDRNVEILLCTAGNLRISPVRGSQNLTLARGASCLIPACAGRYRLTGAGTLFRASVAV